MENVKNMSNPLLGKYKTQPRKHQQDCLNLYGNREAYALFAEMGTGKTWITLLNAADLWASHDLDALFVVAPNGVHLNWVAELGKHMPDWVRYRAVAWEPSQTKKYNAKLETLYSGADTTELRVFTMNWEALQTKRGLEAAERFCRGARRLMIAADESIKMKNPKAARTKAMMDLKPLSHYRRVMDGHPVGNSPFDLFSQFLWLDETILGTTSFYAFKAEYADMLPDEHRLLQHIVEKKIPLSAASRNYIYENALRINVIVEKNGRPELIAVAKKLLNVIEDGNYDRKIVEINDKLRSMFSDAVSPAKTRCLQLMACIDGVIMDRERKMSNMKNSKRLPQIVDKNKEGKPAYKNLDKLNALIAPHMYRVLKKDCLDLPPKVYKNVLFNLTAKQQEIYNKAKEECRLTFEGNETTFNKLVSLGKLAQITSGYYLHPMADEPVRIEPDDNPKIELLKDRVEAIIEQGGKVIVWARYRVEIEDIVKALKDVDGVELVEYHGGVKSKDRPEIIEHFERGSANVFIGNQQAGGTGITLVAASFVIYFSNDFSISNRLQSEDRAHRIGQEKTVTYINLAAIDTIDEHVINTLADKAELSDLLMADGDFADEVGKQLFS